jgi:hypothetical protein
MKSRRRYTMERLHYYAWRILVLDSHANSGSPCRQRAQWAKLKMIDRLMLTVSHLGMPKGYQEHRNLTKQEIAACKRYRRIASRKAKQHQPQTPW